MDSRRVWRWARRVIGVGALLALAVAGAIFLLRPVQVAVMSAARRDIALAIQGVGTVEAKVAVRIAAKITGRLVSVAVDQGDRVRVGQVLATLDSAELQAQVVQTEATVASEDLRAAEAQRRAAQEELAVTQAVLATLRQEVRVAEAALAAARARQTDTEIRSPLDGIVVSRELEPGATVSPGTGILKVADPRTAWMTV